MAAGQVFRIRLLNKPASLLAPLMENVFYYRQASGSGMALELANAFNLTVLAAIVTIQSNQLLNYLTRVENLDDLTDFEDIDVTATGQGTQTGDVLPYFCAYKFQYVRQSRGNHHGWKRLAGVPEAAQDHGALNSGFTTAVTACATALESSLTNGSGDVWNPRIFRAAKPLHVPPVAQADFGIQGVSFIGFSTQNSRKV
jgi:hypothetical protein